MIGDVELTLAVHSFADPVAYLVLKYSDIAGLERSIDTAYEIASERLLEVFFDKFMLMDHLRALKQYLLLGHGDFVDALMGSLA